MKNNLELGWEEWINLSSKGMNLNSIVEMVFNHHGLEAKDHVIFDKNLKRHFVFEKVVGSN